VSPVRLLADGDGKFRNVACKKGINMFNWAAKSNKKKIFFQVLGRLKTLNLIETDKILLRFYLPKSVILFKSKNVSLNIS